MNIAVLGAGAWGTALAISAAARHDVVLWARDPAHAQALDAVRCNARYLPEVQLPPGLRIEADWDAAVTAADDGLTVVATPMAGLRATLRALPPGRPVLWLCKGFEQGSGLLGHEVARAERADAPCGVLSGPSFALEVARGQPTALVAASRDAALVASAVAAFHGPALRVYTSDDVVGVEVGGAVKNVLAIGCGVVEGAGLGQNARAALIARGFAEMTRFGLARGARAETLAGLSGLGDLVLTCSSTSSRNFSLGVGLGRGDSAATLLSDRRTVAEGAFTAPVLREAARDAHVDMPITEAVCRLLEGAPVDDVIGDLLARPLKDEAG